MKELFKTSYSNKVVIKSDLKISYKGNLNKYLSKTLRVDSCEVPQIPILTLKKIKDTFNPKILNLHNKLRPTDSKISESIQHDTPNKSFTPPFFVQS